MEPIGTANRSTSSMGLSATFVPAETDELTHGPKRICCPTIGAGTTKSQKFISITPRIGGTSRIPTMPHSKTYQIWMTQTPSTHRWKIPRQCKSINWLRFFGTFSTLTGMEIEASWNDWKTLMKIFPDILFRFSDRKIWPTLPVIWQQPLRH